MLIELLRLPRITAQCLTREVEQVQYEPVVESPLKVSRAEINDIGRHELHGRKAHHRLVVVRLSVHFHRSADPVPVVGIGFKPHLGPAQYSFGQLRSQLMQIDRLAGFGVAYQRNDIARPDPDIGGHSVVAVRADSLVAHLAILIDHAQDWPALKILRPAASDLDTLMSL